MWFHRREIWLHYHFEFINIWNWLGLLDLKWEFFPEFSYDVSLYYSNHGNKKGGSVAHWFRPLDFRIHRLGYREVTGSSLTAVMLVNSPPRNSVIRCSVGSCPRRRHIVKYSFKYYGSTFFFLPENIWRSSHEVN